MLRKIIITGSLRGGTNGLSSLSARKDENSIIAAVGLDRNVSINIDILVIVNSSQWLILRGDGVCEGELSSGVNVL